MTPSPRTSSWATCPIPPTMPQVPHTATLARLRSPSAALSTRNPRRSLQGVPVYGTVRLQFAECDIFAVDPHIKTPYMENYNLNIQQQLTSKTTLQVGYVGSQGHRLFRFYDINQPNQAAITAADCSDDWHCDMCHRSGAIQDFGVPRPFGDHGAGAFYIFQEKSTGKSNYNSLQVSFKVNEWHGITSALNYVWSKSLDNSSDLEDFVVNAAQPQDSNNPQREYGPSNFNIPHRLTWVFSYELPKMGGACSV